MLVIGSVNRGTVQSCHDIDAVSTMLARDGRMTDIGEPRRGVMFHVDGSLIDSTYLHAVAWWGLVGHSLGGRAALLAVGEDDVRSVVALAPWVHPHDGAIDASGRDVLIVHGTADRIADPRRSAAAAERPRRTARVTYVRVIGGKHAMLRRHDIFSRLASKFTLAVLLGRETGDPLLRQARAGSPIDA